MCGCIGQSGGGWAHYVGQEKLRPQSGWIPLAFATDWARPPPQQNSTSFWYAHTDQWRYETVQVKDLLSPTAPKPMTGALIDFNIRAERMAWLPSAPQLARNPLTIAAEADRAGVPVPQYVAQSLKAGTLEMSCEDPDHPTNWPRNLFVWRSNLLGSSGSRTDPAIITSAEPGELFAIRSVAALVPAYAPDGWPHGTASAIEFGVKALGVRHIIVLGHSFCAGVRCLLEHDHGVGRFEFVSDWVAVAREVREEMDGLVTEAERSLIARRAEQATVLASVGHLAAYPFVAERVAEGRLGLHVWYFHFGWGLLQAAETPHGPFRQVDEDAPPPAVGA